MLLPALLCLVVACERETSGTRLTLVVARDVSEAELFEDASPIGFRRCPVQQDRPKQSVQIPLGPAREFWTDPSSRFEVDAVPREIVLTEQPGAGGGAAEVTVAVARARFDPPHHEALANYRNAHRDCQILVSFEGEIRWVDSGGSDWAQLVPIGVFETSSAAYERLVAADAGWTVRWAAWPELEAAARATHESERRALRMLACDAEFRATFEAENPGAVESLANELQGIDCSAPE